MAKPIANIAGQRFGRLVAVTPTRSRPTAQGGGYYWKCICDCGTETEVYGYNLKRGESRSCGCLMREYASLSREEKQLVLVRVPW